MSSDGKIRALLAKRPWYMTVPEPANVKTAAKEQSTAGEDARIEKMENILHRAFAQFGDD